MLKNRNYVVRLVLSLFFLTISLALGIIGSQKPKPSGYIQGNSYIDKGYGITFKFPKGWHPSINPKSEEIFLVIVNKEVFNYFDMSQNKDMKKMIPYILLSHYNVSMRFFQNLTKISDDILMQEIKSDPHISYKIIAKRNVRRDLYEVDLDMWHFPNVNVKVESLFIKKGKNLFMLSFWDRVEDFDKDVHFFDEWKNEFKIYK